jgi:hypothetical protein
VIARFANSSKEKFMLRTILFAGLALVLSAVLASSEAQAWGGYHVGYTHVGYGGVYHVGYTHVGGYGGYRYGGFDRYGGYRYGGYRYGGYHYGYRRYY